MFTKRGKYDKLMVTDDEIQRRIYPLRPFVIYSAWGECPETAKAVPSYTGRIGSVYWDRFKYIKEAVRAYPELYFAKLVILGEGDSEEIILPKYWEAMNGSTDVSGISIVPLGGRHVNHFWRLLNDLEIPHIILKSN